MESLFSNPVVKIITLLFVALSFVVIRLVNLSINKTLPSADRIIHSKLARDAWIKTIILFAGTVVAALIALANGGFDKAISQAFFGMCLFSAISSLWTIRKTSVSIKEAVSLSTDGGRALRIDDVKKVNKEKALYFTLLSFATGVLGVLFIAFLYDKYPFPWIWFVALICTGFAIQSARWSDLANIAIAKYAADPKHGE